MSTKIVLMCVVFWAAVALAGDDAGTGNGGGSNQTVQSAPSKDVLGYTAGILIAEEASRAQMQDTTARTLAALERILREATVATEAAKEAKSAALEACQVAAEARRSAQEAASMSDKLRTLGHDIERAVCDASNILARAEKAATQNVASAQTVIGASTIAQAASDNAKAIEQRVKSTLDENAKLMRDLDARVSEVTILLRRTEAVADHIDLRFPTPEAERVQLNDPRVRDRMKDPKLREQMFSGTNGHMAVLHAARLGESLEQPDPPEGTIEVLISGGGNKITLHEGDTVQRRVRVSGPDSVVLVPKGFRVTVTGHGSGGNTLYVESSMMGRVTADWGGGGDNRIIELKDRSKTEP